MPTSTQLVTGLAGAIGCDFRTAQNQLIFVEYGGKLSSRLEHSRRSDTQEVDPTDPASGLEFLRWGTPNC